MSGLVLAPFSNSGIRDWPGTHYAALLRLLLPRLDRTVPIRVIGMASHWLRAAEIVRDVPADRVVNLCGRQSWGDMAATLRAATCVVANNSGIAHLAGHLGVSTISLFAGTHSRREWRALGQNVTVLSRAIGCAPCQLDHGQVSPYDKACLREITPETVAAVVMARTGRGAVT